MLSRTRASTEWGMSATREVRVASEIVSTNSAQSKGSLGSSCTKRAIQQRTKSKSRVSTALRRTPISARLSDARYRAAVESFLTSLDAQRTAYGARQDLVATRLAHATNRVTLYRVLGSGLD